MEFNLVAGPVFIQEIRASDYQPLELLVVVRKLREMANLLEAQAMNSVDYDLIGDPREKLYRSNMSKIAALKISLSKIEGIPANITCAGPDLWEQANVVLQQWSTSSNRLNKVDFTIDYEDGSDYQGRLELPWFDGYTRRDPFHHLGRHILEYLLSVPLSPDAQSQVLDRLCRYEIGEAPLHDEVQQCILRVRALDFSQYPLTLVG